MFAYPIKQSRCKLMEAWLTCAGFFCPGMRFCTMWIYENVIANPFVTRMFRNFIIKLKLATGNINLSFSPESDTWSYHHLSDLPAIQKVPSAENLEGTIVMEDLQDKKWEKRIRRGSRYLELLMRTHCCEECGEIGARFQDVVREGKVKIN